MMDALLDLCDALLPTCQGFGSPGCDKYGRTRHFLYTRNELRLQASVGTAIRFATELWSDEHQTVSKPNGSRITFGIVPYVVLWAEPLEYECVGCSIPRGTFDSNWGLSLMMAYDYYPEETGEEFVDRLSAE